MYVKHHKHINGHYNDAVVIGEQTLQTVYLIFYYLRYGECQCRWCPTKDEHPSSYNNDNIYSL